MGKSESYYQSKSSKERITWNSSSSIYAQPSDQKYTNEKKSSAEVYKKTCTAMEVMNTRDTSWKHVSKR